MLLGFLITLRDHTNVMLEGVPVLILFPELDDLVDVFHFLVWVSGNEYKMLLKILRAK